MCIVHYRLNPTPQPVATLLVANVWISDVLACVLVYVPAPVRCCAASFVFVPLHAQTVKATLAKKELQETFLEFDLLGVLKRWLQVMKRAMHKFS